MTLINQQVNFTKTTGIFLIIGFFIPGFTAIAILGLQMLIQACGIECSKTWTILWLITITGSIALPIMMYRTVKNRNISHKSLKLRLNTFNLFEYLFIQASLTVFISNPKMLCYGTDGQNGLEFVFTAWLALPLLFLFSVLLKKVQNDQLDRKNISAQHQV